MERAVLFIIFNRLDTTKKVFKQIKKAKPPRLYIVSDGARADVQNEEVIVKSVRDFVLNNIDWQCEIKTKFRDKNLGCALNISDALNWFFDNEENGVILEDDCVATQSFFKYCEELLDYYKNNQDVWHISGYNFLNLPNLKESYYFSSVPHVWGWATWANRWKKFEYDISNYNTENFKRLTSNKVFQKYWCNSLELTKEKKVDSWAYRWFFTMLKYGGIAIIPKLNMVQNIGNYGTHFSDVCPLFFTKAYEIDEITHPKKIKIRKNIMNRMFREWFFIDDRPVLLRKIQLFIKKQEWRKLWSIKK